MRPTYNLCIPSSAHPDADCQFFSVPHMQYTFLPLKYLSVRFESSIWSTGDRFSEGLAEISPPWTHAWLSCPPLLTYSASPIGSCIKLWTCSTLKFDSRIKETLLALSLSSKEVWAELVVLPQQCDTRVSRKQHKQHASSKASRGAPPLSRRGLFLNSMDQGWMVPHPFHELHVLRTGVVSAQARVAVVPLPEVEHVCGV